MKRLVVAIDNMSIQERHIYSHFYSEPPSLLLKSELLCSNFFQKENRKKIMKQSIQLGRTLKF